MKKILLILGLMIVLLRARFQEPQMLETHGDEFHTHTAEEKKSVRIEDVGKEAEIRDHEREFKRGDTDRDGKLDFNEFARIQSHLSGEAEEHEEGEEHHDMGLPDHLSMEPTSMFERGDLDSSLDLSKEEYLLLMLEHEVDQYLTAEKVAKMADKNEDGKVEKKEFARLRNYDDEMYKKLKKEITLPVETAELRQKILAYNEEQSYGQLEDDMHPEDL